MKLKGSSCFEKDLWAYHYWLSDAVLGYNFAFIHSTTLSECIRIQEMLQLDFRGFQCGLHSRPNIYPCSLIEFLICHLMEPDRRNITAYKTYITLLLNSRTLLTWPNSWHLTAQLQMVRHIKFSWPPLPQVHCVWNKVGSALLWSWRSVLWNTAPFGLTEIQRGLMIMTSTRGVSIRLLLPLWCWWLRRKVRAYRSHHLGRHAQVQRR